MATAKSFQLYINKDNVKQYFTTSGGALNGASIGGKYITMRSSSATSTFTMNDAGRDALFPSADAKANKLEVWAETIATLNNSKNTINVAVAGQNAITTENISTSLNGHTGSVEGIFAKASTSVVYTIKIANGFHGAGVRDTSITAYFWQYSCAANAAGNGVKSVAVSNAEPYEGETVTFSAELKIGATFDGWYSDAACTQLVSTNQTYSTSAAADLTLYAKATITATLYTCSAVAGENVTSATVSENEVIAGESVTFTATIPSYCTFDGWYPAPSGGTPVSRVNPYTAIINSNTTLYARATKIAYTVQVGSQPEGGSANVSAPTATYGEVVTFTANITKPNREFYGWYRDSSYTNLVTTSVTYNHTVTGNITLYPKSGKKRYTAILHPTYASDVRPYRGSSSAGVKTASPSVPQNVNVLANNTVNSSTYAYQSYRASTVHNYGIAFWINNVEQLSSAPDNATIVDLYTQIGVSFSDTNYNSATVYSGTYTYLCEGDETPAIQRGTAVSIPISTSKNIVTINKSQMGNWTIKELKDGNLGFQINTAVKSASGTRQQRFYGIDVYVVYTIEDTSYKCEAISDGHADVSVSSHDVVPGGSCTWTAVQEGGYRFDGWYSDSNFKNLVSTSATYTTAINSNKTLYAKTHYHSRVVARELDVPFGWGRTYFTGKDINGNILDPDVSGSGWKPDFDMSSYGWLTSLVGITDVKVTAASCNGLEYVSAVISSIGMNVLYPNDIAHPVKMDSHALLGRAAITNTLFNSTLTNPITEEDSITPMVDGIQTRIWRPNNINDIPYDFTNLRLPSILNSTRNSTIEYRMHQYARSNYRAIGIDNIRLILYFEEYDFSAQIASDAKGIEAVACSRAIGYEGDSVTFTTTLLPDVVFDGWCTEDGTVVSTDETYTCVPNANLTLYAKAHATVPVYSVAATAGAHVASATVNHLIMTSGNPVIFTASVTEDHWEFDGWYLNGTKVSSDNPYNHTITANTTLEARAKQIIYTVNLQQADYGVATATPSTGVYGAQITLSWQSSDEWHDFDHWEDVTNNQSLSTTKEYVYTITGNVTIRPVLNEVPKIIYNVVAGEGISSAYVSKSPAKPGEIITFTAVTSEDYIFDGWYEDPDYSHLVSNDNPLEAEVYDSPTEITVYAKGTRNVVYFNAADSTEGIGTSSIAKSIKGEPVEVTFSFEPNNGQYEDYGWYSDAELTQVVSYSNVYTATFDGTSDVTLYPASVLMHVRFIAENTPEEPIATKTWAYLVDYNFIETANLDDVYNLFIGNFNLLPDGVWSRYCEISNDGTSLLSLDISFNPQLDAYKILMVFGTGVQDNKVIITELRTISSEGTEETSIIAGTGESFYVHTLEIEEMIQKNNNSYFAWVNANKCSCYAETNGAAKTYLIAPKMGQGYEVNCTIEMLPGYEFQGVYLDADYTIKLDPISAEYPYDFSATTPVSEDGSPTTLTFYVKSSRDNNTGLYIKTNGIFIEATAVYKKVDGAWVQQDDPKSLFLGLPSGSESNYIYCGEL
ncbi:MAG: InlB B-repeat-containing protein [Oscillospiraceae bacterium]|nr:InlB B-repeat-containing protein [Oscillospiraceae bacterium]